MCSTGCRIKFVRASLWHIVISVVDVRHGHGRPVNENGAPTVNPESFYTKHDVTFIASDAGCDAPCSLGKKHGQLGYTEETMVCLSPNLILVIACFAHPRPHREHDHNKAPGGGGHGGRKRGRGGGYGTPTSHCVAGCLTTRDLFVAVITCSKYHDTRCQRIKRGYGAMLPAGHLAFYSDADDASLPAYKILEPAPRGVNERSWGIRKCIPAIADAYRRSSVRFARCRYARSGACVSANAPDARLCVCNARCSVRDGR